MSNRFRLFILAVVLSSWAVTAGASAYCDENGCTIHICAPEQCEIRHCVDRVDRIDEQCSTLGFYPNPSPGERSDFVHCGQDRCAIRTCNENECNVVGFERGKAYDIVSYENLHGAANKVVSQFLKDGAADFKAHRPDRPNPSDSGNE